MWQNGLLRSKFSKAENLFDDAIVVSIILPCQTFCPVRCFLSGNVVRLVEPEL
jgi:hypothetical protein